MITASTDQVRFELESKLKSANSDIKALQEGTFDIEKLNAIEKLTETELELRKLKVDYALVQTHLREAKDECQALNVRLIEAKTVKAAVQPAIVEPVVSLASTPQPTAPPISTQSAKLDTTATAKKWWSSVTGSTNASNVAAPASQPGTHLEPQEITKSPSINQSLQSLQQADSKLIKEINDLQTRLEESLKIKSLLEDQLRSTITQLDESIKQGKLYKADISEARLNHAKEIEDLHGNINETLKAKIYLEEKLVVLETELNEAKIQINSLINTKLPEQSIPEVSTVDVNQLNQQNSELVTEIQDLKSQLADEQLARSKDAELLREVQNENRHFRSDHQNFVLEQTKRDEDIANLQLLIDSKTNACIALESSIVALGSELEQKITRQEEVTKEFEVKIYQLGSELDFRISKINDLENENNNLRQQVISCLPSQESVQLETSISSLKAQISELEGNLETAQNTAKLHLSEIETLKLQIQDFNAVSPEIVDKLTQSDTDTLRVINKMKMERQTTVDELDRANGTISHLENEKNSLLLTLSNELARLSEENQNEMNVEISKLKEIHVAEILELTQKLETSNSKEAGYLAEIESLKTAHQQEIDDKIAQIKQENQFEIANARDNAKGLFTETEKYLETEIESLKEKIKSLNAELQDKVFMHDKISSENEANLSRIKTLDDLINDLKKKNSSSLKEFEEIIDEIKRKNKAECSDFDFKLASLNATIFKLETDRDALINGSQTEASAKSRDIEQSSKKIQELHVAIASKEQEITRLTKNFDDNKKELDAVLKRTKNDKEAHSMLIQTLQDQINSSQNEKMISEKLLKADFEDKLKRERQEVDKVKEKERLEYDEKLKKDKAALEDKFKKERLDLADKTKKDKNDIEVLKKEKATLEQQKVDQSKRFEKELTGKSEDLLKCVQKTKSLEGDVVKAKADNIKLIEDLKVKVDELEALIIEKEASITSMNQKLQDSIKELEASKSEIEQIKSSNLVIIQEMEVSRASYERQQKSGQERDEGSKKLKQKIEEMTAADAASRKMISKLEKEKESILSQVSTSTLKIQELEQKCVNQAHELTKFNEMNDVTIKQWEASIKESNEKIEQLEQKAQTYEIDIKNNERKNNKIVYKYNIGQGSPKAISQGKKIRYIRRKHFPITNNTRSTNIVPKSTCREGKLKLI